MVCPKCGSSVKSGDNFCEECGASLMGEVSGLKVSNGNNTKEEFAKSQVIICDRNLAAATNKGRRHHDNEDAGTVLRCENGDRILIVADGVSSSVKPTIASRTVIEVIKEVLTKDDKSPMKLVAEAIEAADTAIKALPYETKEDGLYGPETTVVVALVKGNKTTIGWVGDSRAYIMNKDIENLLTIDDSWVEQVVAEGSMTREEASLDRRAHCVTQVLGMHDQSVKVHFIERELMGDDMLLLCSDGLWNYFQGENSLLSTIKAFGVNSDASAICEYLVGLANAAGGRDNITVAILKNFDGELNWQ
jgi:serine/threonine protein phosphatase PrpC